MVDSAVKTLFPGNYKGVIHLPPRADYSSSDMLRMQRDAEMRVHQMRNRARTVAMMDGGEPAPALNRNWSTATGRSRQLPSQPIRPHRGRHFPRGTPVQETPPAQENNPPPDLPPDSQAHQHTRAQNESARQNRRAQNPAAPQGDGTIIGDVMGALGMEEDTLLIIGLLLILINQKADTTLLLALAYLLI